MFLQGTGKGKFDKGKGKTPFSAPKAYQVCGCHLACAVALCYSCREKGKAKLTSLSAKPPMTPTAGRCRLSERRTGVSALLIALMCNILCCNRSSATTVARQGTLQQNAQRRHDVGSSVAPPVTAWDRSHMLLLRQERHNSLTLKRQLCPLIQTQVSCYSLAYSPKTLRISVCLHDHTSIVQFAWLRLQRTRSLLSLHRLSQQALFQLFSTCRHGVHQ